MSDRVNSTVGFLPQRFVWKAKDVSHVSAPCFIYWGVHLRELQELFQKPDLVAIACELNRNFSIFLNT